MMVDNEQSTVNLLLSFSVEAAAEGGTRPFPLPLNVLVERCVHRGREEGHISITFPCTIHNGLNVAPNDSPFSVFQYGLFVKNQ